MASTKTRKTYLLEDGVTEAEVTTDVMRRWIREETIGGFGWRKEWIDINQNLEYYDARLGETDERYVWHDINGCAPMFIEIGSEI